MVWYPYELIQIDVDRQYHEAVDMQYIYVESVEAIHTSSMHN
jgi:hypothetical protein